MNQVNDIILKVKQLDREHQLNLLERVVALIHKTEGKSSRTKLSSITGIGSELWTDKDIDQYIESERAW